MQDERKYIQLRETLKAELRTGRFKAGARYYTDKELMEKHRLSYATVSHALAAMVAEGFFERRRGRGTFVKESTAVPGMTGDIMTRTLFINSVPYEDHREQETLSWFVVEEIRRGIINNYPGPVKIEPFEVIGGMVESGEEILAILHSPPKDFIVAHGGNPPGCVVINHRRDFRMERNSVSWEMISGVYELMGYLLRELGHRRVGFIGGDRPEYFADRFAGYRIGLEAYGVAYDEALCVRGLRGGVEEGRAAMEKLLALSELPTAVFADTDLKAMGAIEAITAAGLRVPEDISVAGFDDMPGADKFHPPLTTVRIPYYDIGEAAAEMLLDKLRTGAAARTRILRSEMVARQSCCNRKG